MSETRQFELYAKLPVVLQNVACTLAGIGMRRARHGRVFHEALCFLDRSQRWSASEQREYQNERLRWMIRHAYETVPYYHELFRARKLRPEDIRTVDDLPKLPFLEKDTVRARYEDLQSRTWPKNRCIRVHTGGTTGKALSVVLDKETVQWQWAMQWSHRMRFGAKFGDPFVVFAGRSVVPLSNMHPPIWRRNLVLHQTYVSVHHMTKQNMPALVDYLQRRRVAFYCGYPSGLYLLATHLLEHGIRLTNPPRMVFSGAESVLPHHRRAFAEAFGTEVGDHYGLTETCAFISECERHRYHLEPEFSVIELVPLESGTPGLCHIVGTGLCNPAMPLIRYNTGDLATLSERPGPCDCGRASRTLEKIDGRIESYVITPDGRQLGRLDFLFKKTGGIDEAQLVQDSADHVTIRLVRNTRYTLSEEITLMSDLRRYLGSQIRIDLDPVDEIPREPNGKFRAIVSRVFHDRYRECMAPRGDRPS